MRLTHQRGPADRNGGPDLSDPVLRSREHDQDRPGRRKVRLPFGVGQRPHDDPELRARRIPGAAAFLGAADGLRLRALQHQDPARSAPASWCCRCAAISSWRPSRSRRWIISARAGWRSASASAPIARNSRRCSPTRSSIAATSSTRACRRCNLLFKERVASFDGKYYKFKDVELFPKPLQKKLPIYVGGNNENNIRRTVKWADGWLPAGMHVDRSGRREADARDGGQGRPRSGNHRGRPQFVVHLGKTREAAIERYPQEPDEQAPGVAVEVDPKGPGRRRTEDINLIGTPDEVVERALASRRPASPTCSACTSPPTRCAELLDQMQSSPKRSCRR